MAKEINLDLLWQLAVVGRYALASNLETWHSALPNTQMPTSLLKILQPYGYFHILFFNVARSMTLNYLKQKKKRLRSFKSENSNPNTIPPIPSLAGLISNSNLFLLKIAYSLFRSLF